MTESMHKDPSLGQRIWAGDVTALEDARKRYEADPEGQFVPWISTLYSFRRHKQHADELAEMLPQIMRHAARFESQCRALRIGIDRQRADQADVLSTILLWLADQPRWHGTIEQEARGILPPSCRAFYQGRAVAILGLAMSDKSPGQHTPLLLELTLARAILGDLGDLGYNTAVRQRQRAWSHLDHVYANAEAVIDRNQQARIWRKLGALYLRRGGVRHYFRGLSCLRRARLCKKL